MACRLSFARRFSLPSHQHPGRTAGVEEACHVVAPVGSAGVDVDAVLLDGPAGVLGKAYAAQGEASRLGIRGVHAEGHHRAQGDVARIRGQGEPVVDLVAHGAHGAPHAELEEDVGGVLVEDLLLALGVGMEPDALLEGRMVRTTAPVSGHRL